MTEITTQREKKLSSCVGICPTFLLWILLLKKNSGQVQTPNDVSMLIRLKNKEFKTLNIKSTQEADRKHSVLCLVVSPFWKNACNIIIQFVTCHQTKSCKPSLDEILCATVAIESNFQLFSCSSGKSLEKFTMWSADIQLSQVIFRHAGITTNQHY